MNSIFRKLGFTMMIATSLSAISNKNIFFKEIIMKNLSLLMSFLGALIFGASAAFAAGTTNSTMQKITSVAFHEVGFFMYGSGWDNPNGCDRDVAIVLLKTDPNYDKAYALLLTAFASGKEIRGYSDGCAMHDGQSYNTIRGFKYLVVN